MLVRPLRYLFWATFSTFDGLPSFQQTWVFTGYHLSSAWRPPFGMSCNCGCDGAAFVYLKISPFCLNFWRIALLYMEFCFVTLSLFYKLKKFLNYLVVLGLSGSAWDLCSSLPRAGTLAVAWGTEFPNRAVNLGHWTTRAVPPSSSEKRFHCLLACIVFGERSDVILLLEHCK